MNHIGHYTELVKWISRKTTHLGGLSHERTLCVKYCATFGSRFCFFILVDSGQKTGIKREFRRLRTAASLRGWIAPGRRPGPVCRLRAGFPYSFFSVT